VNGVESIPKLDWDKFVDTFDQLESSRDKLDYLLAVLDDYGIFLVDPNLAGSIIIRKFDYIKLIIPGVPAIIFSRSKGDGGVDIIFDWALRR
jgi:hypothetical protein